MISGLKALYVKCRPQNADALEISLRHRRVFIGYPPWREGGVWDRHDVHRSVLNISVPDDKWHAEQIRPSERRARVSYNRKFALNMEVLKLPLVGFSFAKSW